MGKLLCVLTALLAAATLLCAQGQVATVTSTAPFQLRGANVTTDQGVTSWPIMAGDVVKADSAPLVIAFAGGSSITLEPGSSAKITMSGQTPTFRLENGTAAYSLSALSAVILMALDAPVSPAELSGVYSTGVSNVRKKGAGTSWWTPGRTALVLVGAGAAAGLGFGIAAATSGGTAASPSQP